MRSPSKKSKYGIYRRIIDVIHERTGLSVFIGPFLHEIKYIKWEPQTEDDEQALDFDSFFSRMPPFEPIAIFESKYEEGNTTIRLKGDHVWFILPVKELVNRDELESNFREFEEYVKAQLPGSDIKCKDVICGVYDDLGDKIILKEVVIPRVVNDGKPPMYKKVEFNLQGNRIKIYYGLHKIAQRYKNIRRDKIPHILKENLAPLEARRGYSPYTLNYVTTCHEGYVIATDPTAVGRKCDPCEDGRKTLLCKNYPGRGIYEWHRRIFPKIYSKISVQPSSVVFSELDSIYSLPYSIIVEDNVAMSKDVDGFTMYLNKIGKIELELDKKISTGYFNTNALITVFDTSLVKIFLDTLRINKENIYFIATIGPYRDKFKIPVYSILVSKYLWYKVFNRSLSLELKADENNNRLVILIGKKEGGLHIVEDMEKITREFIENDQEELESLELFTREVLAHTIAHTMFIGAVRFLPESREYIDYFYSITGRYVLAGTFENTKDGMLRLSREIANKMRSEGGFVSVSSDINKLNPRVLRKIVESVIAPGSKANIITLEKEAGETGPLETYNVEKELEKIATLIADKISSKDKGNDQKRINPTPTYKVIYEFYTLLLNTLTNMVKSGFYIDPQIFTYILLWEIIRKPDVVVSYLRRKTKLNEDEIKDILDELLEAELYKILVEMLFPDICLDGCGFDLYLSDCHSSFDQPFVISRSLLLVFLEFLGDGIENIESFNIKVNRVDCTGEQLKRLCNLARRRAYILTSELGEETINLIRNMLQVNQGLKLIIEVDTRLQESKPGLIEQLKSLETQFKDRFELKITEKPHHGKLLELDDMKIHTSWNFGTSIKTLQTFKAELKR